MLKDSFSVLVGACPIVGSYRQTQPGPPGPRRTRWSRRSEAVAWTTTSRSTSASATASSTVATSWLFDPQPRRRLPVQHCQGRRRPPAQDPGVLRAFLGVDVNQHSRLDFFERPWHRRALPPQLAVNTGTGLALRPAVEEFAVPGKLPGDSDLTARAAAGKPASRGWGPEEWLTALRSTTAARRGKVRAFGATARRRQIFSSEVPEHDTLIVQLRGSTQ